MNLKELFGKVVLDNKANEIGKIDNADINIEDFSIESFTISLKKSFTTTQEVKISPDDISTVGQYILLNIKVDDKNFETKSLSILGD